MGNSSHRRVRPLPNNTNLFEELEVVPIRPSYPVVEYIVPNGNRFISNSTFHHANAVIPSQTIADATILDTNTNNRNRNRNR